MSFDMIPQKGLKFITPRRGGVRRCVLQCVIADDLISGSRSDAGDGRRLSPLQLCSILFCEHVRVYCRHQQSLTDEIKFNRPIRNRPAASVFPPFSADPLHRQPGDPKSKLRC